MTRDYTLSNDAYGLVFCRLISFSPWIEFESDIWHTLGLFSETSPRKLLGKPTIGDHGIRKAIPLLTDTPEFSSPILYRTPDIRGCQYSFFFFRESGGLSNFLDSGSKDRGIKKMWDLSVIRVCRKKPGGLQGSQTVGVRKGPHVPKKFCEIRLGRSLTHRVSTRFEVALRTQKTHETRKHGKSKEKKVWIKRVHRKIPPTTIRKAPDLVDRPMLYLVLPHLSESESCILGQVFSGN